MYIMSCYGYKSKQIDKDEIETYIYYSAFVTKVLQENKIYIN